MITIPSDFAFTLVSGAVLALLSSFLAVFLSLRQFREERRWEKKHEAYTNIFQALYDVLKEGKVYFNEEERQINYYDDVQGSSLTAERKKELAEKSTQGMLEVDRMVSIGAFVISYEAVNCLEIYQKKYYSIEPDQEPAYFYYYENLVSTTEDCIKKLQQIAIKDIGVKKKLKKGRIEKLSSWVIRLFRKR